MRLWRGRGNGSAEDTAGIVRDNSEGDWLRDTDAAGIQCGDRHPYVQATDTPPATW